MGQKLVPELVPELISELVAHSVGPEIHDFVPFLKKITPDNQCKNHVETELCQMEQIIFAIFPCCSMLYFGKVKFFIEMSMTLCDFKVCVFLSICIDLNIQVTAQNEALPNAANLRLIFFYALK